MNVSSRRCWSAVPACVVGQFMAGFAWGRSILAVEGLAAAARHHRK